MKVFLHILLLYGLFLKSFLWGEEFSKPRDFSNFESNLGEQKLVEVVHPWVGVTPQELVPGAIVLGSLKNRAYVPAEKIVSDPPPLEPVKKESVEGPEKKELPVELPENKNFPLEIRGDPVPVERSAQGWVGPLPHELAPRAVPLGSLANRRKITRSHYAKPKPVLRESKPVPSEVRPAPLESQAESVESSREVSPPSPQTQEEQPPLNMSIFASTRGYYTHNVLRLNGEDDGARVWENMAGASLSTRPFALGQYVTMVPSLDLMMQTAAYEDKEVSGANLAEILGYRFGMVKTGLSFSFPRDYSLSLGYEYTMLNSLDTGDKMSDGFAPSLRLGKMFSLGDTTLLMMDGSARYSITDRVMPYPIPGQFADDGDNYQLGLSLSLIQLFGANGQFMLMPSLSITRSEYLKNTNDGRVDWSTVVGLNGSWQATDWLSLDLGLTWSFMQMNDIGEALQGQSSKYQALDIGGSIMASHTF
jgi:hypothetical protein